MKENHLNNLKVTFQKNANIFIGATIAYTTKQEIFEQCVCPSIDANRIDFPSYLKENHPYKLLENIKFLTLSFVDYHRSKIEAIHEPANFINDVIKRNTFKKVTQHLTRSGITQKLIDAIPVNHAYYGMREICFCGIEDCYHSDMLIVKHADHFVIPYFYSFASPHYFLDFDIRNLKPTKEYDLNEEDEDDWENIFDDEMNYLGKKKPEFLSSHIAKQPGFKIGSGNLFKMS